MIEAGRVSKRDTAYFVLAGRFSLDAARDLCLLSPSMELLDNARLQTILDHAEIGTWEWDLRAGAAVFDARAKAVLGYPPEAELRDVAAWEAAIHPEDAPAAAAKLRRHLAAPRPEPLFEVEHRVRHTETDSAWVSIRGQVIERDADGRALRMMGIVQDISSHKADHAEIARQNQVLEAVREAQAGRIEGRQPSEVFERLLGVLLHATQSGYGFIGEVMHRPDGVRYLKTHAITNIAWDDASRALFEAQAATGFEFHNLGTLFGVVLTSGPPGSATDPARVEQSSRIIAKAENPGAFAKEGPLLCEK